MSVSVNRSVVFAAPWLAATRFAAAQLPSPPENITTCCRFIVSPLVRGPARSARDQSSGSLRNCGFFRGGAGFRDTLPRHGLEDSRDDDVCMAEVNAADATDVVRGPGEVRVAS